MDVEKTIERLNANAKRYSRPPVNQKILGELMGYTDRGVSISRAKHGQAPKLMRSHLIALELLSDIDLLHVLRQRLEDNK